MITFLILMLLNSNPALADEMQKLDDSDVCKYFIAHHPSDDVAFKSGKDVKGKPVVEADLSPSPAITPNNLEFDVTVDMAEYLKIETPKGLEGRANIGRISIDDDGTALFNGAPLDGDSNAALRALCSDNNEKADLQKSSKNLYNP